MEHHCFYHLLGPRHKVIDNLSENTAFILIEHKAKKKITFLGFSGKGRHLLIKKSQNANFLALILNLGIPYF